MGATRTNATAKRLTQTVKWMLQTQLGITFVSLAFAIGVLLLLVIAFGESPVAALGALFEGALRGRNAFIATIEEMTVLILTGIAILIPVKGGYFNIGCQGQLEMGALAAVFVATNFQEPRFLVIALSLLVSMVVGALIGSIPLVLRVKRGASEATSLLIEQGANEIYTVTGPGYKGVWEATQKAGVPVVAYAYDSYDIAPDVVAASVTYDGPKQFELVAQMHTDGTIESKLYNVGYDYVGIADFRGSVDAKTEKKIQDTFEKISSGELSVPEVVLTEQQMAEAFR